MAQPTVFKESDAQPLYAGENPNTNNMPVCRALNKEVAGDIPFFVSKWKFSAEEKNAFRNRVYGKLREHWNRKDIKELNDADLMDVIEAEFDHVWLCLMHTPVPALILSESPFEQGYEPITKKDN